MSSELPQVQRDPEHWHRFCPKHQAISSALYSATGTFGLRRGGSRVSRRSCRSGAAAAAGMVANHAAAAAAMGGAP